ncbi:cupin domain-containing protein [Streptomyces litchfieldiae]|uniref:Cupin domain-containing protein n=1 Tax=Streptomyces litchfieldiae TaxID=3075543 RepID=A0ABU2MIQ5_9ACTN|nr:cupin domain-containing protein [Streptomyces sp. DSM 44938]MDT0341481.1 cupin domain-containing protein [Streptomyces sp. DSM 44938]
MSYPEPRYHEDTGRVGLVHRPANSTPDLRSPSGTRTFYLATGRPAGERLSAVTDGEFGLYHIVDLPPGAGTGTHFHRTMSESFFVTAGSLRVFDGERWIDAPRGDFLYVPPGGLHGFANESDEPASFLMLFVPGAPREGYFEGLSELAGLGQEEREDFFAAHDSYFIEPGQGPRPDGWPR